MKTTKKIYGIREIRYFCSTSKIWHSFFSFPFSTELFRQRRFCLNGGRQKITKNTPSSLCTIELSWIMNYVIFFYFSFNVTKRSQKRVIISMTSRWESKKSRWTLAHFVLHTFADDGVHQPGHKSKHLILQLLRGKFGYNIFPGKLLKHFIHWKSNFKFTWIRALNFVVMKRGIETRIETKTPFLEIGFQTHLSYKKNFLNKSLKIIFREFFTDCHKLVSDKIAPISQFENLSGVHWHLEYSNWTFLWTEGKLKIYFESKNIIQSLNSNAFFGRQKNNFWVKKIFQAQKISNAKNILKSRKWLKSSAPKFCFPIFFPRKSKNS